MNPVNEKSKLVGLDLAWAEVGDFHDCFGHPAPDSPALIEHKRAHLRSKWMCEEIDEFLVAATVVDQADAMVDLIYFALGTLVEMGVPPQEIFAIVHKANMSKLGPDGKVHYNSDGKVIKPASWCPPEPQILEYVKSISK